MSCRDSRRCCRSCARAKPLSSAKPLRFQVGCGSNSLNLDQQAAIRPSRNVGPNAATKLPTLPQRSPIGESKGDWTMIDYVSVSSTSIEMVGFDPETLTLGV